MNDLTSYKKTAIEAVKAAEERILYYFHHLPKIEKKADMSPVTKADKEAEEIIISTIKKQFPNHGFLGEEFGKDNESAEFQWIIDPIDGTKNFIHGLDFYGTVLGLKYQGKIILGVSNMPSLDELLVASEGEQTTLNREKVHVSNIDSLDEAYVTMGGFAGLKNKSYLDAVIEIESKTLNMRGYGDVHGYHLVATGRADIMFEPVTKPWDISAYQIIIKQAGGRYSDFYGNDLALGPTSLATNGHIHGEMLEILKPVTF
ncbi:MAG TPA: inositol monophosphatase family protein [Candidatus Saccharimonadales bacterium]|nr:inositol monophosphatase family protein [Candidatus Saccharimonadales bacterium]